MWRLTFVIIFLPLASFSKECKSFGNSVEHHFINGVGNDVENISKSIKAIKQKLEVKFITPLINPRNNEDTDFLHKKLNAPLTWAEIKEVFSQKIHESLRDKYIVDETVDCKRNLNNNI